MFQTVLLGTTRWRWKVCWNIVELRPDWSSSTLCQCHPHSNTARQQFSLSHLVLAGAMSNVGISLSYNLWWVVIEAKIGIHPLHKLTASFPPTVHQLFSQWNGKDYVCYTSSGKYNEIRILLCVWTPFQPSLAEHCKNIPGIWTWRRSRVIWCCIHAFTLDFQCLPTELKMSHMWNLWCKRSPCKCTSFMIIRYLYFTQN